MTHDHVTEAVAAVVLERQRYHSRRYLSPQVAETVTVEAERLEGRHIAVGDLVAIDVIHEVLAEKLPPQTVTHRVRYTHPEAIGRTGYAADARFATWLDHFAATYRTRWWGRLLRLHRRELRYTFVKVPYIISAPVECDHRVTVSMLDAWLYPHAETTVPGFGEPILYSRDYETHSVPQLPYEDTDLYRRTAAILADGDPRREGGTAAEHREDRSGGRRDL